VRTVACRDQDIDACVHCIASAGTTACDCPYR
jgi:hypothetical protein